ncbi:3'-5' exonuclease [Butyrivibrio sp. INlla16]|uniref:3'-5' exonuclease n=1 Tax=Butyrivibrio sp. INlla16 TaxID=1520807 RepID=UPI00088AAFB2|nr:3'-5' exonuclease [Butyrivibrio sp. INlla16]SDB54044.1 UvrD/REP helicase N-terminal domain-containing protein [Butyrivibrio sp. INlla16]
MGEKFLNVYNKTIEMTDAQMDCIDYVGEKVLMVKGAAGTGKSAVIQYKALKYLEEYEAGKNNKVIIFTYNKSLVRATKQILSLNGDKSGYIKVTTPNAHFENICLALKLDRNSICDQETKRRFVREALQEHKEAAGVHRLNRLSTDFWEDEIRWMKESNVTTNDKEYYLKKLKRPGRGTNVVFSDEEKEVAFDIFSCYMNILRRKKMVDWEDLPLYIIRHPERIPESFKYDHVLIDEAQDLSLAQMMAAMMIYKKDMFVALDINQRLYGKHWTTKQLGISSTTKKLEAPMRTTMQIEALAESLRAKNDDDFMDDEDDISLREIPKMLGTPPTVAMFNSLQEEKEYVIRIIRAWLKESDEISIGILAAKKTQLDVYASWMTDAGIPKEIIKRDGDFDITKPGVKIVTTHSAKGMEFFRVIIPQFNEGNFPYGYSPKLEDEKREFLIKERNRAYVAMTRARVTLNITCNKNKKSRFFDSMDRRCYDLEDMTIQTD